MSAHNAKRSRRGPPPHSRVATARRPVFHFNSGSASSPARCLNQGKSSLIKVNQGKSRWKKWAGPGFCGCSKSAFRTMNLNAPFRQYTAIHGNPPIHQSRAMPCREPIVGRARHSVRAAPATSACKISPASPSRPTADQAFARVSRTHFGVRVEITILAVRAPSHAAKELCRLK